VRPLLKVVFIIFFISSIFSFSLSVAVQSHTLLSLVPSFYLSPLRIIYSHVHSLIIQFAAVQFSSFILSQSSSVNHFITASFFILLFFFIDLISSFHFLVQACHSHCFQSPFTIYHSSYSFFLHFFILNGLLFLFISSVISLQSCIFFNLSISCFHFSVQACHSHCSQSPFIIYRCSYSLFLYFFSR
jgi:hypothetical protein